MNATIILSVILGIAGLGMTFIFLDILFPEHYIPKIKQEPDRQYKPKEMYTDDYNDVDVYFGDDD